ncbi:hypothetical protein KPL70_007311 [Citrus sinensis]|nr:hypothetical protein KPL70_007311 [Citrus sinensis]
MSSLMQFKSAPVSKRAMASIAKSSEKIKVTLMTVFALDKSVCKRRVSFLFDLQTRSFLNQSNERMSIFQRNGSLKEPLHQRFRNNLRPIHSCKMKKVPEWKLLDSNRTIESEHPPLRSVTVDHGEPPVQIRASPYKIPKPNDSEANLSSIIQQNNFCNTNLNTIGKQLTRIENQIQKSTITVPSISHIPTKSDSDKKLKEPIFKPFQVSKTSQKLVQESKSDFAKAIREQLDRIEAASSSSSKVQIAPDTPQSSKIGVLEHDQMSIASSDIEAFKEEPSTPKANKIHWELALPIVKTPPDLAIDNRPSALNQSRYNASSVYEWNIDGMSEYNIIGLLQQMTMAANAYKTQAGTSDRAISEILIAGFTGQLKGWWDHLPTNQQQLDILNSIQVDENGVLIFDEFNNPIQDAVATLILTISLHFIGDPSHLRDKNAELLHNLRCRKLSEFQSYKTSFFTRLFLRDDANHITWKEKFLAGLPTLLGENVRNSIKALYDNRIPYDELTYGELDNSDNESNPDDGDDIKVENIESVPNDFLFVLKQITTRKYLIKVTLIFSDDFAMDAIALFDTGADLNCIREDIVPKRFHEKTKERLSAANNSKLNVSSKIMPPKKKDKGKAVLKDSESRATSKEPQATPSKDKLLSSAMPIKSWIEMVEEHGAHYKTTSSDDQVKQWMSSITKSPELMLALQNLSQSQIFSKEEKENPISKEISKPSSQIVIVSGESSFSQIVLSQPSPSKKTSD